MVDVFEEAEKNMQWCMDKAYKIVVHARGITDWSKSSEKTKDAVDADTIKVAGIMMLYLGTRLGVKPNGL